MSKQNLWTIRWLFRGKYWYEGFFDTKAEALEYIKGMEFGPAIEKLSVVNLAILRSHRVRTESRDHD